MADAEFHVTNGRAPRLAVAPDIRRIAAGVRGSIVANTPRDTGTLAGSWQLEQGRDPATSLIATGVPYLMYVEYGTRRMPARAPAGRAIAEWRGRLR